MRLTKVVITDPYLANAFELELHYLRSFDVDRLIAGFRETKGLFTKAQKYPGWESTEIRGHTLGHFMKALAQAYAQTRDSSLLDKLQYIVCELSLCQFEDGYLSAFPETLFDNVENKKPAWVPWYTMHKIVAGLIEIYHVTQSSEAYRIVEKLGDWVANRTSRWSKELQATVLKVEYGGMNDCLYDLYKITGYRRHLDAAHQFDELPLFCDMAQKTDWAVVLDSGFLGKLDWLEYSLKRSLGTGPSNQDQELGTAQVIGTIADIQRYESNSITIRQILKGMMG